MKTPLHLIFLAAVLTCQVSIPVQAAPSFSVLASFSGANGETPQSALIQGKDGNFYGTTTSGGLVGLGSAFKMTPSGALTTLASFNGSNGAAPFASLLLGKDGNFYGTTGSGVEGPTVAGSIFKLTPAGVLTTLYTFNGTTECAPQGLIQARDGNFYGTSSGDGFNSYGSIFKMTPAGVVTTLLSFEDVPHGGSPQANLIEGRDGNFYGTTWYGGTSGSGIVFKVTPTGILTSFSSYKSSYGSYPAALVEGIDGNFYSTASLGGANYSGTVFRLTPTNVCTRLVSFNGTNGSYPLASLIQGSDGNFYGTTVYGGTAGEGTVFKMTPEGVVTVLVSFNGSNGAYPSAALLEGSDGNFYGTARMGGTANKGVVFKIDLDPQAQTITFPTLGAVVYGQTVMLGATASSGLAVSYSVLSGPATLAGNKVTFTGIGTVKLVASQVGNTDFKAAKAVAINVSVRLAPQTLSAFKPVPTQTYGAAPFTISLPTASSGFSVTVTVKSGSATISGNTITITGAGAVTLIANQKGDAHFAEAKAVTTSFVVNKAAQSLVFPPVGTVKIGQVVTLGATASSGLPVTYSILTGSAFLSGNTVTFTGVGTVKLAVDQPGNANIMAAKRVAINVSVR